MHSPYAGAGFVALAHRGGSIPGISEGKENTLAAFASAVELGYRFLETDVHATRDHRLIAFHDDRLDRVSEATGLVRDRTFAEIRKVSIHGEQIPTLDEILESFPEAVINIDLKAAEAVPLLAKTIEHHRATQRVCVGSFSISRIHAFRRLTGGRVATTIAPLGTGYGTLVPRLPAHRPPTGVAYQVPLSHRIGPLTLHPVTRGSLRDAHRAGKVIHVWTINDAETMNDLIDLGVDGIVTDAIDVLKTVMIQRGLWP